MYLPSVDKGNLFTNRWEEISGSQGVKTARDLNTHQKEELEEEHEQVSRNSLVNCKKQEYQLWKCVKGDRREKLFLVLLSPCSY